MPGSEIETGNLGVARCRPAIRRFLHKTIEFPIEPDPATTPWTTPDVWRTLQAIIMDQLQADASEVREQATFQVTSLSVIASSIIAAGEYLTGEGLRQHQVESRRAASAAA